MPTGARRLSVGESREGRQRNSSRLVSARELQALVRPQATRPRSLVANSIRNTRSPLPCLAISRSSTTPANIVSVTRCGTLAQVSYHSPHLKANLNQQEMVFPSGRDQRAARSAQRANCSHQIRDLWPERGSAPERDLPAGCDGHAQAITNIQNGKEAGAVSCQAESGFEKKGPPRGRG